MMKIEFALDNKSNTTSKDKAVVVMDTKSLVLQTTTSQTTTEEEEEEDEATTDQRFPRLLSDDISVDSNASCSHTNKWSAPYDPAPVVDQSTILWAGLVLFILATVWPPLLLLVAYIASKLVPYSFRVNDDPVVRRRLFAEFASTQEDLPPAFKQTPDHLDVQHGYWTNKRGMLLHTVTVLPKNQKIKAVVCFCHGYTDSVSFVKLVENQRLPERGIAFCAIEYEGHGLSDGALGLFNDWNLLIGDVCQYFTEIAQQRFPGKPMFLMGESMGGAVSYSVYNTIPNIFKGVVFLCPMCKISDNMLPPQPVINVLKWLIGPSGPAVSWLGYLPIAPARNSLENVTHRVLEKRALAARSPLVFGRNPRLATARELIDVTQRISSSLGKFNAPFLVCHGKADVVTDPALSQALYDESPSKDKTIHLYDGMWHSLTSGEPDENIDRVFADCTEWILARAKCQ